MLICLVGNKTSFVCVEPLHLSQWCWLGRRRSQEVPAWCLRWSSSFFVDPQRSCEGADEATRPADPTALRVWASPPWDGRSIAWIHRSQSAATLITLPLFFFIHLSEFCSSVLFFFAFLDAQSSDAPQTHFYRSLLFVPTSVVLKNRGVSVLVDFACQRIIKETTLFYYCFDFPYGWHCIFHVDTQPCPKEKVTSCYSIDIHFIFSQIRWLILWNYTSRHKTMFVFIFLHLHLKEVKKETFTFGITTC